MLDAWHNYPSIFALGHAALRDLLSVEVLVEEKIDGSQFSFGRFGGRLRMRSRRIDMDPDAPAPMFAQAAEEVRRLAPDLLKDTCYRGEYLRVPKHNVLAYDREPQRHIIIFDVEYGASEFLSYEDKQAECERLGLEVVPRLWQGPGTLLTGEKLLALLKRRSVLGGQLIEGVVVKPARYDLFGRDKHVLMGKYVSEVFKETHAKTWKVEHGRPKAGDIIDRLGVMYATPARWQKAVQHLDERGELEGSPRDIGKLIGEVPQDILNECQGEIAGHLLDWAQRELRRRWVRGLPEWYKQQLLARQFDQAS